MIGEGERVDLDLYVRILVASDDWGKREVPRRPAPPRSPWEMFHSLTWRSLCGVKFRQIWEKSEGKAMEHFDGARA